MSENIDFRVDYNKFKVMDEFNTDELKYPLILSIPHCGTVFPEEFLRAVRHDVMTLRKTRTFWFTTFWSRQYATGESPRLSLTSAAALLT